ncbi:Methyltransferase [Penicillium ucsense]|uniref:Methyltransferase n=1 Tax=Penicillium ucsense TaxID=2839758 RepID=A0A8J8VZR0_9EURO|nr:Methyltransferase [Penicillium ucsense]KAF7734947.1 Methyltransferase [Penicillium ucsense]
MPDTTTTTSPGEYLLIRNAAEKERLEMQFQVWQAHLGYLLHPTIKTHEHMRIADVGTGTGAWLREVAKTLPATCQLDGFDVSDALFDGRLSQVQNISFHLHNILRPFPENLVGKYDIVNVRLLAVALSSDEWVPAVRNLIALLKPGGRLQWSDCAPQEGVIKTPSGATPVHTKRMMEIFYKMLAALGKTPEIHRLLDMFQQCGLVSCEEEILTFEKPEVRDDLNLTVANVMAHGLTAALELHKLEDIQSEQQITELRDGVLDDLRTTDCFFSYDVHVVLGQKPL